MRVAYAQSGEDMRRWFAGLPPWLSQLQRDGVVSVQGSYRSCENATFSPQ